MLLQYIAKKFGELVGKGLPARVIAEFMGLSVPFTVAMTLPMAVLVAVLYSFSRLAAENEITALKASGVAMRSVLGPVFLGAAVLAVLHLAFLDGVLPRANHRLAVLTLDIFRTKPTFALRDQVINTIKEGQLYLRAGKIEAGTGRMRDVVIYDLSDPLRRRTIYADSGTLASRHSDLDLMLYHGVMQEVPNNKPADLTRLFYETTRKKVMGVFGTYQESQAGTVSKGDREMSVCEMQREFDRADFQMRMARYEYDIALLERDGPVAKKPPPPKLGDGPLGLGKAYCRLLSLVLPKAAKAQNIPPRLSGRTAAEDESFRARRQEVQFRIDEARRERNRYYVPPWVAMWGANLVLLVLGLVLTSQMGKESTTARGGDFAEFYATMRAKVFGWLRMFGIPVERRRA
jgi:lipopolysaccharide export system permease protein